MKIQLNILSLLIVLGLFLGIFFIGRYIGLKKRDNQIQRLYTTLEEVSQTKSSYEITIDSLTEYVNQINNVLIEDENLIDVLREDNERLKELNIKRVDLIADLQANVEVLNKQLQSQEPVTIIKYKDDTTDLSSFMKLPVNLSYKDKWAFNRVHIDSTGLSLTDFGLYETRVNIILGKQRDKWYRKANDVTAVTTPNPYLTISPEQVKVVRPKPAWYERKITWLLGGAIIGVILD